MNNDSNSWNRKKHNFFFFFKYTSWLFTIFPGDLRRFVSTVLCLIASCMYLPTSDLTAEPATKGKVYNKFWSDFKKELAEVDQIQSFLPQQCHSEVSTLSKTIFPSQNLLLLPIGMDRAEAISYSTSPSYFFMIFFYVACGLGEEWAKCKNR